MAENVQQRLREIAERVAETHGLEVVEVELRGGGKGRVLRVFLDRLEAAPGGVPEDTGAAHDAGSGVTHEDCANFSREFGAVLDVEDVVPGAQYTLEVSSPGLDRKLSRRRDFERFVGQRVRVIAREAINGRRNFEGTLVGVDSERVKLDLTPSPARVKGKKQ